MRIFQNFDEVQSEVKRDLKELAVVYQSETVQDLDVSKDEGYRTHELINYTYTLQYPQDVVAVEKLEVRPDIDFIAAEMSERVHGGLNPGESWAFDPDYWGTFLHDGKFAYTYSERIGGLRIEMITEVLMKNPNSRQAWLSVWDKDEDPFKLGGVSRVPCSLGYQYFIRNGCLHSHYVMRSCDFIKHFQKDAILAILMQNWIKEGLQVRGMTVDWGTFTHTMFSLHAFAKDLEGVF